LKGKRGGRSFDQSGFDTHLNAIRQRYFAKAAASEVIHRLRNFWHANSMGRFQCSGFRTLGSLNALDFG
jgi:hypothetical protein